MNRRNFLGGALLSIPFLTLKWPRLKSDVPQMCGDDPGACRCTVHDAYTGKDITSMDFWSVDCEKGITERYIDHRTERTVREYRWVIVRLHPDDKAEL